MSWINEFVERRLEKTYKGKVREWVHARLPNAKAIEAGFPKDEFDETYHLAWVMHGKCVSEEWRTMGKDVADSYLQMSADFVIDAMTSR
jgi:hypothetical protein